LVLSPVILEPHAIGTLGNSGGQNSHSTPSILSSTSSLIPPWIDIRSTAALLDTDQLPIHLLLALGVPSISHGRCGSRNSCCSAARQTQLPHSGNVSGSLLFVRSIHVVPCRLLRSSYASYPPVGVSTPLSVAIVADAAAIVVHSHELDSQIQQSSSCRSGSHCRSLSTAHPVLIDSLVVSTC
jgi:hypothetical protein